MIKVLIQYGVDVTQKDNLKQSPLYYTARDGKIKLCQFLIEQGIQVNEIDIYGQNGIYYAVNLGHLECVRLLKAYGSDHDHIDENKQTPLFYAIKSNREPVLKFLLELGCDLSLIDNRGHTPMNIALRHNKAHFKDLLVHHGAPVPPDGKIQNKKQDTRKMPIVPQPKARVNERMIPKDFVLQIFDGEQYRPITQEEFENFANDHPQLSKFFTDANSIDQIQTPQVDESVPIYYHWEKVAWRMMHILTRK